MAYEGDILAGATLSFKFSTVNTSATPTTLAGTPAVSVYKNGSTTESTAGVTLTVDFDGRTGLNHVAIDTSADGTFYAAGNDYQVVVTAGTVGGTSVVGAVCGDFSIENRTQKADVRKILGTASAGTAGYMAPDWGHVNAPTTTVNLSGTTVGTVTAATLGNTAHGGAASTLTLRSIAVNNSSGYALNLVSSDSPGLHITGGTGSPGVFISGQSDGMDIVTSGTGDGIVITAGVGSGINITAGTGFAMTGGDIDANLVRKVLGGGAGTITGDGVRAASVTGAVGSIASGGITTASFASGATVPRVTLVDTTTTVTNTVGANVLTWLGTTPLVLVSQKVQAAASIANYLATGTVASTTGTTTTLDTGAVNTASYYANSRLVLTAGTGAGQERVITGYASGRIATHAAWTTNPNNATTYEIRDASSTATATVSGQTIADGLQIAPAGTAAAGSTNDTLSKILRVAQAGEDS